MVGNNSRFGSEGLIVASIAHCKELIYRTKKPFAFLIEATPGTEVKITAGAKSYPLVVAFRTFNHSSFSARCLQAGKEEDEEKEE